MMHVHPTILVPRCVLRLGMAIVFAFLAVTGAVRSDETTTPRTDLYGDPLPPRAVARLGTVRLRHAYSEMTFSADGKRLISCDGCGEVRIWDVVTGRRLATKRQPWKSVEHQ